MKQKEVFKKIGGIIQELNDQYDYLKTVPDDLNDLELELFVSNAHFLTDHIEILCKLNLQIKVSKNIPEKPEVSYQQKYFEPVVQQMKHNLAKSAEKPEKASFKPIVQDTPDDKPEEQPVAEIDLTADAPEDTYSFIREEPETIRHELILDESMDLDEDEKIEQESELEPEPVKETRRRKAIITPAVEEIAAEVQEEKPVVKEPEKKPISPSTVDEEEVLTINQKMSQSGDKARSEQLSIKPISDIKLAITLNDKLLYVKDLFNGYNLAYSEAIEILNRFNTFEEAQRFLKTNYVTKNNWDGKPATTEKFYALLKRRYA